MLNRMNVDAYLARSAGMGSFGLEEVKWLRPVFAGDTLSIRRSTSSGGCRRAGRRWGSSSFTGRC
jgi:acyl dehydratase